MTSGETEDTKRKVVVRWIPTTNSNSIQMPSQAPSPVAPVYLPTVARPPSAPILNNGSGSMSSQVQQPRFRLVSAPPPPNNGGDSARQAKLNSFSQDGYMPPQQMGIQSTSSQRTTTPVYSPVDAEAGRTVAVVTPQEVGQWPAAATHPTVAAAPPANKVTATAPTGSDQAVHKCARFFKTLLQLSEKQQNNQEEVKRLVRDLVFGGLSPENFTVFLQRALNSQAQSNLQPFLRQTLPALRRALQSGQQVIEGIGTAEEYVQDTTAGVATNGQQSNNIFASTSSAQQLSTPLNNGHMNTGFNSPMPPTPNTPKVEVKLESPEDSLDTSIDTVIHNVAGTSTQQPISATAASEVRTPNSLLTRPHISSIQLQHIMLNGQALADRIFNRVPDCEGVEPDVLELISNATETRLKALIAHLAVASEHRLEPLRLTPHYKQVDEPRKQLRFMEDIERQAYERRENLEREALLRFSKSKGKDKDTMEKAKQVQKADKEAAMNREANAAAIAALGGSRAVKRPSSSNANNYAHSGTAISNNPMLESAAAGLSVQSYRPRVKRVTMRDLQFVLRSDPFTTSSSLRHKIVLSRVGTSSSTNADNSQQ